MSSSKLAPSRIIGIQFGMLSPEEIERNAVVEVKTRDTYVNNKPLPEGLFDPRMGVLEPGLICPTDGLTYIDTPGYFGCIKLAKPVLFLQHIKDIMKIAKCVCFKCSKLLINKNQHKHVLDYPLEKRWDYVAPLAAKVRRCGEAIDDGCGCKQPEKVKLEGFEKVYAVWKDIESKQEDGSTVKKDVNMRLTPEVLLKIFRRISDEDCSFMGFSPVWSRPEWMICQVLPVPPPAVRPSVKLDAQQRSEDDLTHIYANIVKTNKDLFDKLQKPDTTAMVIEGLTSVLQYFVAMIVNNKIKGAVPMAQRSGRPLQCIMGRLNSKNGRIRGNLMGKRVDYSARSVITGDPNLSVQQLGVPMKIAKNLTKPVIVNDKNRDFLMQLIQNGPDIHPGAKIVERKNGEMISLRYADVASIRLENGDTVHRHMMDGDAVLFNRQPSLHRMSMMCHIVKIMKQGDSFRFNVACTKPYNADFDGDEMNMHLPQNVLAETELRHLAAIPYQVLTPVGPGPLIGIYQDSLLGSFRFTRPNVKLTPREAMNLLAMFPRVNTEKLLENKDNLTSFDVLSQILPEMTLKYKKDDNVLEVRNGKYVSGQLEKSMLGASTKGIIHRIYNDYGPFAATDFIDDLQQVVTEYMKTSSFSVGISDLIANKVTQEKIVQIITEKKMEVQTELDKLHLGIFKNDTSNSNMVQFETTVNNILNKATELSGKEGRKSLSKDNRFLMIVESGSKGTLVNISQMISCLGQTNVDGKRISYGFEDRTLPHFKKFDDSPGARGFIENSYISGLTAPELFFHAMGGRIGLIDTAVKTSSTGYIQRRLIKGLEDLKVEYDMTVRNNRGKIVQFSYGDDGIDSTRVEAQAVPLVSMSVEDIYMHYDIAGISEESGKEMTAVYTKGTATRLKKQRRETVEKVNKYIERMLEQRDALVKGVFRHKDDTMVKVPVSFQHLMTNLQGQLGLNSSSSTDVTPLEAFDMIEETFEKLKKLTFAPPTKLFEILYYFYLTPRELLVHKRFHRKGLELLLDTVFMKYKQSIVHPGEMVGVVAGQSIGEPTTQLTLNTFHLAGVASKSNVTRGVPRIEEILRLTDNPKKPAMTIHLKSADEADKDRATVYANMLEHTVLRDVVQSVQICFDPLERSTFIESDKKWMETFYAFEDMMKECNEDEDEQAAKSKWVVRMELDAEALLERNITMDDVHFAIKNVHSDIQCIYSDYNDEELVFRIRTNADMFKKKKGALQSLDQSDEIYLLRNFQDGLLNNIVLRGVQGIENVLPRKLQNMVAKEDGKYVKKDTWVLDTTGTNMLDVLGTEFIDFRRTYSNDIGEMFDVLGIEAARQIIFNEFSEVMEFSDVNINYHHLSLLCDRMTVTKDMVAIFRSGLHNDNIGPIAKATFEVHTEILLQAARHADFDEMRGVSANVMCGQFGYYGTGAFNVILDMTEMAKQEAKEATVRRDAQDIESGFSQKEDLGCANARLQIQNNIKAIHQENEGVCQDQYDMGF
jgi:DNA-directed RNA polymerase II subunit RPB1